MLGGSAGGGARVPVHYDRNTVSKDVTDTTRYLRVLHQAAELVLIGGGAGGGHTRVLARRRGGGSLRTSTRTEFRA